MRHPHPIFHFRGCLNASRPLRVPSNSYATVIKPPSATDKTLIEFFDQQPHPPRPHKKGFLLNKQITSPGDFKPVTLYTLRRAQFIVERILRASSEDERLRLVTDIDRLSDTLCRLVDLAELVRNTHPDNAWVEAAHQTYDDVLVYMNGLNTTPELARVFDKFIASDLFKRLRPDAQRTAKLFQEDFHKSGIDLPLEQRQRFVELSSEIISHGREFQSPAWSKDRRVKITKEDIEGSRRVYDRKRAYRLIALANGVTDAVWLGAWSKEARSLLKSAIKEETRKKVFIAQFSSKSPEPLEKLLRARAQLAQLVGFPSYAHMLLKHKMSKSPENVRAFLDSLLAVSKPRALDAIKHVAAQKKRRDIPDSRGFDNLPTLQLWDRDAYFPSQPPAPVIEIRGLTVGLAVAAFSRFLQHAYGMHLEAADVCTGEVWHADVRKVNVLDEGGGVVGWIYFDLFNRPGKPGGACHYTVRCSRRVDLDDAEGDFGTGGPRGITPQVEDEFVLSAEAHGSKAREGLHQRPVAVIVCDVLQMGFSEMKWNDVVTLWHELGHAMHSMIGRTEFGNIAGTRCATDFVELPSILMEHFLTSPDVLSLFFDKPVAYKPNPLRTEQQLARINSHTHVLLASLDQHYHASLAPLAVGYSSTDELRRVQEAEGVLPFAEGTYWQAQFDHLFGYGASYYSYLFDRAIATRVWRQIFQDAPLERAHGERLRRALAYGGGKDPWEIVAELLEMPQLAGGGSEAMKEVGRWGVQEDVASEGPLA